MKRAKGGARRGFSAIGIHHPKCNKNMGGVLRAADAYDAAFLAVTGKRYQQAPTDVTKAHRHLPLFEVDDLHHCLPRGCVPVAIELLPEARPLPEYTHPERAFYIFGGEDQTLSTAITDWCRDVVYVPTRHCMNLMACVNVVLYDRLAKSA